MNEKRKTQNDPMNCIIVDDEPLAVEVLATFVEKLPGISCLATCADAFEAMKALQTHQVDLMFLDINMPGLSGLSLLRSLSKPPLVVFTTAYAEHAVEGFELEALDYLLKPIAFERFARAVQRAQRALEMGEKPEPAPQVLLLKADRKLYRIPLENIHYIESIGDYVKVFTEEKCLVSKTTLKKIEQELDGQNFIRIHKSYICPLNRIQYIEGNRVRVGEKMLPIGQSYKEELIRSLTAG
jgi:DNA-binding LytR/AlgR family response regulator